MVNVANSKQMRVDADFDRFIEDMSKMYGISKTAVTRRLMEERKKGKKLRMLWDDVQL